MVFDLLLAAAVAAFAVSGYATGLVRQVSHWSGLLIGGFAAWPAAAALTPWVAPLLSGAPGLVEIGLAAVLYLIIYAAGALAVQGAIGKHKGRRWDRWGGAALGAVKGVLILYTAMSAFLAFEKPLAKSFGALPAPVRASRALALVRRHDFFAWPRPKSAPKASSGIIVR